MRELPMLYSTPMVQAIIAGRKTVTRRSISTQPDNEGYFEMKLKDGVLEIDYNQGDENPRVKCPYGSKGDVLWVRETWAKVPASAYCQSNGVLQMPLDDPSMVAVFKAGWNRSSPLWKPSIHMPKITARIWLQITNIKVERLHGITEADAIAEGVEPFGFRIKNSAIRLFQQLWQSINGEESWNTNPWVWVISFKVLSTTGKPATIPSGFKSIHENDLKSSLSGNKKRLGQETLQLSRDNEGKEVSHG